MAVIQRLTGQDGRARSTTKRSSMAITSGAANQVSSVTQRLTVNRLTGRPNSSMPMATRWATASLRSAGGAPSGPASGRQDSGMPGPRRKVWKWPCSPPAVGPRMGVVEILGEGLRIAHVARRVVVPLVETPRAEQFADRVLAAARQDAPAAHDLLAGVEQGLQSVRAEGGENPAPRSARCRTFARIFARMFARAFAQVSAGISRAISVWIFPGVSVRPWRRRPLRFRQRGGQAVRPGASCAGRRRRGRGKPNAICAPGGR